MKYTIVYKQGHYELRDRSGRFICSADSYIEAVEEAVALFAA